MPKKLLTDRKLKALVRDEHEATKEYKKLGLPCLAKDEAKHARFLEKLEKKKR